MNARPFIDVRELPHSALDHRSPIWWGNLLLLVIETTMFVLLTASYFYLRMNYESWPPPQVNTVPPIYDTRPSLSIPTTNLVLILLSVLPMIWADRASLKRNLRGVKAGLVICILMGLAAIAMRFHEFDSLKLHYDDNAYGSITWTILGLHLTHLIVGTAENVVMTLWVFAKSMDDKHARDIRVGATYWYWIAGTWIALYGLLFVAPYFL
jgi:cytochrome c oxidase subunit 3